MCGILGGIYTNSFVIEESIKNSLEKLNNRGPNSSNYWISYNKKIFLAHTRLSINDLSPLGSQPMFSFSGRYGIILNGEIYNFIDLKKILNNEYVINWKSTSDTEVLLHYIEKKSLNKALNDIVGMYSFALIDLHLNKLFLVRDRIGEKPLFYGIVNSNFYFSSELKSIFSFPVNDLKIHNISLNYFLSLGYIPNDKCIVQGFKKLPPAHFLEYDLNSNEIKINKYWDIYNISKKLVSKNQSEIEYELEVLINNSVKNCLIADVPIGILLSGGLDSSIITGIASRFSKSINTFTVSFPGFLKYDEKSYAKKISDYFGTTHHELEADVISPEIFENVSKYVDEPIADSSLIPTFLISKMIRQYCVVALGGDGGDELFGGYNHYQNQLVINNHVDFIPQKIKQLISNIAAIFPLGFKGKNFINSFNCNFSNGLPNVSKLFDDQNRKHLFNHINFKTLSDLDIQNDITPLSDSLIMRYTLFDLLNYLPEDILVKIDRMSMMNSLEMRAPLLDHRIVEYSFSQISDNLKTTYSDKKIILKALGKKILPKDFNYTRKQGFSIPLSSWFKSGNIRDLFWDTLLANNNLFNKKYINKLLNNQDKGYSNSERIFALYMFEKWRIEYKLNDISLLK